MFVTSIIVFVLALIAFAVSASYSKKATATGAVATTTKRGKGDEPDYRLNAKVSRWVAIGTLVLSGVFLFSSSFYTQDPGQAKVLRSWTGDIVGQSTTEGFKFKAPWVDTIDYDIRNQQVIFALTSSSVDGNARPSGAQITVQDREGVTANIDITVRYSVKPDSVTEIYKRYQTQENFVARFIENDIRAAVRTVPAKYKTLELLNNRAQAELDITDYLMERWEKQGVTVETVSLQEIRYSDDVKQRFDDAQASRIRVEQAKADLEATEVSAQQKVVQAQAEAEANSILAKSLTTAILQQRYLDTLKELAASGNLVVVPEGFNGLVNVGR